MNSPRSSRNRRSPSPRRRWNAFSWTKRNRRRSGLRSPRISPDPYLERRSSSRDESFLSNYDDRDQERYIRDLQRDVRDRDEKLHNYRQLVANLERRLLDVEAAKAISDLTTDRLREKLALEYSKEDSTKGFEQLRMQVQTQALLLRKLNEGNFELKQENAALMERLRQGAPGQQLNSSQLGNIKNQIGLIRNEWTSMREKIGRQFISFIEEFEEMQGHMTAIMDTGFLGGDPARSALRMEGKVLVEERHLQALIGTIIMHTKAVAQDCYDLVCGNMKE